MKAADDAYLRLSFVEATEEFAHVFRGKPGKLPANWRPSREDLLVMSIWAKLYERIGDTEGGLEALQEVDRLQGEVGRLNGLMPRAAPRVIPEEQ